MATSTVLLPAPRELELNQGQFALRDHQFVRLAKSAQALLPAGQAIQSAVEVETGLQWELVAGGPDEGVVVTIEVGRGSGHAQGYRLVIAGSGIRITGDDAAGAFYGAQTLAQLIRQYPERIPCLTIEDWPDFPARGVMLDVSRDKVPTLDTLLELVDLLASWKINQIQLYTEHTFAYRSHPEVWAQASPLTGEDILTLDSYCRERFVELVPNQNSFGHMHRWLTLPRYRHLAEAPDGFVTPWGERFNEPFSLCPGDPGSLALVESLFDELLPHFSCPLFNVGCDETWDLGKGRSQAKCEAKGTERVYLDFLLQIHRLCAERGKTMQFWGDIIMHRPDLIPELPKDIIALEWGYEADHPFASDVEHFRSAGIPFYVCPGTSSWNTIAGRTENAIGNLLNAAENGRAAGAIGYLNTDWGDNGHLQYLPVSYLGFAVGAALSWSVDANRDLDVRRALDLHAFRDSAGVMGGLAYELGNAYLATGKLVGNATVLFHLLHNSLEDTHVMEGVTREGMDTAEAAIGAAVQALDSARMERPDSGLVADEFRNAAAMLRLACRIGRYRLDSGPESAVEMAAELRRILGEHRRLWLARNRPGGLNDSTRHLESRLSEISSRA